MSAATGPPPDAPLAPGNLAQARFESIGWGGMGECRRVHWPHTPVTLGTPYIKV